MKSISPHFRLQLSLVLAGFLIASASILPGHAQTNGAPSSTDASVFPGVEHLPGKPPSHVWAGLAAKWARDHAQWQPHITNDIGAVVFLGDSITEGWTTLARDFPNLKVADRGIDGDVTSGVLFRLQADVLSLDPGAIVLLIGTNDLGDGSDPADVADNVKEILRAIKKFNPKLKVIVCKVMPRGDISVPVISAKIKQVNALVEDYVKTEPNFAICDTWSIFADDQGAPNPVDFRPDHLHLNAAGYVVWKTALDPVIAKMNFPTKPQ